jgi:hypothetical protein
LSAGGYLVFNGSSTYHSASAYGEWPFSGSVTYCASSEPGDFFPKCAVPEVKCESDHHRLRVAEN